MNNFNIVLVIGNSTCGTCTALNFENIHDSMKTFFDIKQKGRKSIFLNDFQNDNIAGISFSSSELINVSLDAEDDDSYPIYDIDNLLTQAIALGYEPISI